VGVEKRKGSYDGEPAIDIDSWLYVIKDGDVSKEKLFSLLLVLLKKEKHHPGLEAIKMHRFYITLLSKTIFKSFIIFHFQKKN
jgi:hypothetical protein